jgi:Nuclease-related domain
MALSDQRWERVSESPFPWEREALDYIRANLPDQPPYYGWSNFTFIDETSTVGLNEVDCLVVTPQGLFLIEIKSDPGVLRGDRGTWRFEYPNGRIKIIDNPLIFANTKAKKLKALLMRQPDLRRHTGPPIFIEPLIFLSHPDLTIHLPVTDRTGLCWRSKEEKPGEYKAGNIIAAINTARAPVYHPTPEPASIAPYPPESSAR